MDAQAFEKASAAYGLTHDVTLKATIELADLLLMRRGHAQALELVQELLSACRETHEPLLTTGSALSSLAPSDRSDARPDHPQLNRTPQRHQLPPPPHLPLPHPLVRLVSPCCRR